MYSIYTNTDCFSFSARKLSANIQLCLTQAVTELKAAVGAATWSVGCRSPPQMYLQVIVTCYYQDTQRGTCSMLTPKRWLDVIVYTFLFRQVSGSVVWRYVHLFLFSLLLLLLTLSDTERITFKKQLARILFRMSLQSQRSYIFRINLENKNVAKCD